MGDVRSRGSVRFRGEEIAGLKPHQTALRGLGYVPETRDIFPGLTVRQNLQLGEKAGRTAGRWEMADMLRMFPQLEERADMRAGVLSGGEQQMLTICRTLMGDPDLVMIDEPTEGLSPMMVEHVGRLLEEIARRGVAILLIEQKLTIVLRIAHRLYVMGHGKIVYEGTSAEARGGRRHPEGMAGSVNGKFTLHTLPFGPTPSSNTALRPTTRLSRRP